MRWLCISLLISLAACAKRDIVVTAQPSDADITIDGVDHGAGPIKDRIRFKNKHDVHFITATREGFQDKTIELTRDDRIKYVVLELDPTTRKLTFHASPVAAIISINGEPISNDLVSEASKELPFSKDENGNWTKYTITAARTGFIPAQVTATYTDPSPDYTLQLQQPTIKDISITTDPPGVTVAIDDKVIGQTPGRVPGVSFSYDPQQNKYSPRRLTLSKPGYDPVVTTIGWDNGKTDYYFVIPTRRKTVRILTDPPGASVSIDGKDVLPNPQGIPTINLTFKPIDNDGRMPTYTATVTKQSNEGAEWTTATIPIEWDDSKTDYTVSLKQLQGHMVPDLAVALERDADGVWQVTPRLTQTLSKKDVSEGPGRAAPSLIYQAPRGVSIGSLVVSPSGSELIFTQITGSSKSDLRSQIMAIDTNGLGFVREITDGKALDIMPSYTPRGDQIVFCSNRAGRRLNIWRKTLSGSGGMQQLTDMEEQDLWPTIDAAPKPRLFYEALSDSLPDAQLFVTHLDGGPRTDLSTAGASQPRIGPKADTIVYTGVNPRTKYRDVYRVSDHGGTPTDLTNDFDSDNYDPAWSRNGGAIVFVSDRAADQNHERNPNIWTMDLSQPDKPTQMTVNGSVNDCPAWDPDGAAIYFRSNRGGQWGIWKIAVK